MGRLLVENVDRWNLRLHCFIQSQGDAVPTARAKLLRSAIRPETSSELLKIPLLPGLLKKVQMQGGV